MEYLNQEEFDDIWHAIDLLHGDLSDIFEIRMLNVNKGGTVRGYFNEIETAVKAIASYNGDNDIYITLNSPDPDLLARSNNRLERYAKHTTSNDDIVSINWVFIDIDPVRKAGISSTEEEKDAGEEVAQNIVEKLEKDYNFPEPVVCDSGNGFHLLYRINLESTKESEDKIHAFLNALDAKFSTDKAKVDTTTYNRSRIVKLYGTIACKGDHMEKRPHRRSYICQQPETIIPITLEDLERVIKSLAGEKREEKKENANNPKNKKTQKNTNTTGTDSFDVEKWLEDKGIQITASSDYKNKGIKYKLNPCPWREEHTNNSACVIKFTGGGICAKCHHDSCSGENWFTLRDKYEPGWRDKGESILDGLNEQSTTKKDKEDSPVKKILEISNNADYFHTEEEEPYACVPIKGHTEIHPISNSQSRRFKLWISNEYYHQEGKPITQDAFQTALNTIQARAVHVYKMKKLYNRCAWVDNKLYYDLNNEEKEIICIDSNGWEIIPNADVMFLRRVTLSAQVTPEQTEFDIELFKKHYKFKTTDDHILHTISLIAKFMPQISHPIDILYGEQGSGKSTALKKDKSIVDPSKCDLVSLPQSNEDFAILFNNNYFLCFDNLDNITTEKSNLLCMASTGGFMIKRKKYTDSEEAILELKRPLSMNGINLVATKADLLDRAIILELEGISADERQTDAELFESFNEDKPRMLGMIFSALSKAIKLYPTIVIKENTRLADFAKWGYCIDQSKRRHIIITKDIAKFNFN